MSDRSSTKSSTRAMARAAAKTPGLGLLRFAARGLGRKYPYMFKPYSVAMSRPLRFLAMGEDMRAVPLHGGAKLIVSPGDFVGRVIYYMGDFDPRLTFVTSRLLQSGDKVFDVGANLGWMTMTCAQLVGAGGRVHAFEPQPELVRSIQESTALNGFNHVVIHECALSDSDGTVTLHLRDGNRGAASLEGEDGPGIDVKMKHAGDYFSTIADYDHIQLMKLDVEGHETTILAAANEVLRRRPPPAVLFESLLDGASFWERGEVVALANLGYRFFALEPRGKSVALHEMTERYDPSMSDFCDHMRGDDYLALHGGATFSRCRARLDA